MSRTEFVALIAMMFASIAFAIDSMLPALPQIAAELVPLSPEKAPLILSAFLIGMGLGTFFSGPLSDAFGRKKIILFGALLYMLAATVAWASTSIEMMLIARVVQGLGASGPRVVALAVIRDRFAGRQMAQIVSIVMMIFTLFPAVAPLLGTFIIAFVGWRGILLSFVAFAAIFTLWMLLRLPETLAPENRRPMKMFLMVAAVGEMLGHPVVRLAIVVQTLIMTMMFLTLMLVQPIFDQIYGRAADFPYWFFVVALIAGSASLLNALLVVRFGMQRLITMALAIQIAISFVYVVGDLGGGKNGFIFFVIWQTCMFAQAGLTIGNLNALAMEPMGHIAGMAASVTGAIATVGSALISALLGTVLGGDERLLFLAALALAVLGFCGMMMLSRAERRMAVA